jgi:hypothetical protein
MCGRFTLRTPARDLVEVFELLREPELSPRYNIAPTQNVAVIRQDGKIRQTVIDALGPGADLVEGPQGRSAAYQCSLRDDRNQAFISHSVQAAALPDSGRRILRVAEEVRRKYEDSALHSDGERPRLRVRRTVGDWRGADGSALDSCKI